MLIPLIFIYRINPRTNLNVVIYLYHALRSFIKRTYYFTKHKSLHFVTKLYLRLLNIWYYDILKFEKSIFTLNYRLSSKKVDKTNYNLVRIPSKEGLYFLET